MGERTKLKDVEKSPLALSCNAKEEILLNKKLRVLEAMKKQAENSHTLDQRVLYNRFATKLRRSEVAHAKLVGNQELVKHFSWSLFPTLHPVVTDSDKAVRVILQNAETSRVILDPCRIQTHLAPISASNNQGRKGEIKNQQKTIGAFAQKWDQEKISAEGQTGFSKPVNASRRKRPHTTNHQLYEKLSNMNVAYEEIFKEIPSQPQHPAPQATEVSISLSPKRLVNKVLKDDLMEPTCMSSQSRRSHKWFLNSKTLFLGLDNIPLEFCPNMNNHMNGNSHNLLDKKVKHFIQVITTLKRENPPLLDYYSERLQETLARKGKVRQDTLWNTEKEQSKWTLVGPEPHHQSITIKKLDRNFMRDDSSLEILVWKYYNEILTKENLLERNWLNNNPYQPITN